MNDAKLVVIGRAGKPFGIKGEIKISIFTESFDVFENSPILIFDDTPKKVAGVRFHKGNAVVALEGVHSPEEAETLVGAMVKTDVKNLPPKEEGEYYWHELIGLKVTATDGRFLGEIVGIMPTGANDVLQVEGDFGEVLLPMIDDVVLEIDTDAGTMLVDPLEGLVPHA